MGILGRLMGRVASTLRQPERGGRGTGGTTTERNVGGRQAGTPVPPELPLDDDGTNARNLGG